MLVKLDSRAKTTPVPMDQGDDPATYTDFYAIGFGDIDPASSISDSPDRLQDVKVSYITNEQCQNLYGFRADITDNMLCAAAPGKDSCQGDSVRSNSEQEYHRSG